MLTEHPHGLALHLNQVRKPGEPTTEVEQHLRPIIGGAQGQHLSPQPRRHLTADQADQQKETDRQQLIGVLYAETVVRLGEKKIVGQRAQQRC